MRKLQTEARTDPPAKPNLSVPPVTISYRLTGDSSPLTWKRVGRGHPGPKGRDVGPTSRSGDWRANAEAVKRISPTKPGPRLTERPPATRNRRRERFPREGESLSWAASFPPLSGRAERGARARGRRDVSPSRGRHKPARPSLAQSPAPEGGKRLAFRAEGISPRGLAPHKKRSLGQAPFLVAYCSGGSMTSQRPR